MRRKLEEKERQVEELKQELEKLKEEKNQLAIDVEDRIQTEYSTKFCGLQAELKENKKENKRLKNRTNLLEAEVRAGRVEAEEEKRKRENVERHVATLRGLHSRLFMGVGGGGGVGGMEGGFGGGGGEWM